jgi:hypothetical protein
MFLNFLFFICMFLFFYISYYCLCTEINLKKKVSGGVLFTQDFVLACKDWSQ